MCERVEAVCANPCAMLEDKNVESKSWYLGGWVVGFILILHLMILWTVSSFVLVFLVCGNTLI